MSTIIRRSSTRRSRKARVILGVLALAAIAVLALAWQRGGPQPQREIAVALPEPGAAGSLSQ